MSKATDEVRLANAAIALISEHFRVLDKKQRINAAMLFSRETVQYHIEYCALEVHRIIEELYEGETTYPAELLEPEPGLFGTAAVRWYRVLLSIEALRRGELLPVTSAMCPERILWK